MVSNQWSKETGKVTRMIRIAKIAAMAGLLALPGACTKERQAAVPAPEATPMVAADPMPFGSELVQAAQRTHARYIQALNAGKVKPSDAIPAEFWEQPIKDLKPLRVYQHRVNIMAVQKTADRLEEGIYITIPISSYFPQSGVDGFEFTPKENNVFLYKRQLAD